MIFELHKHNIIYKRISNEIIYTIKRFNSNNIHSKNTFITANHKNNSPIKYIPDLDSAQYILENGKKYFRNKV